MCYNNSEKVFATRQAVSSQPRKGAMLMSVYDFFAFIVLLIALIVSIKA